MGSVNDSVSKQDFSLVGCASRQVQVPTAHTDLLRRSSRCCRWSLTGRSDEFEASVTATCSGDGTALRAPTAERGLAPACRDSFSGSVHLQVCLHRTCPPNCGHEAASCHHLLTYHGALEGARRASKCSTALTHRPPRLQGPCLTQQVLRSFTLAASSPKLCLCSLETGKTSGGCLL